MRKQDQRQPQLLAKHLCAAALALSLLGGAAVAAPQLAAKPGLAHGHAAARHTARSASRGSARGKPPAHMAAGAGASPLRLTPQQWQDFSDGLRKSSDSTDLSVAGDAAAGRGDWPQAAALYRQALDTWPNNTECLFGLGQCAAAAGDLPGAIRCYRAAVYVPTPNPLNIYGTVPGDGFQTNDVKRLMQFALLLDRAGQAAEGVFIYNRAAALLDYEGGDVQGGKQTVRVLLPEMAAERALGDQVAYTPARLQALADMALAYEETGFISSRKVLDHTQEAARLYPDSAVTSYYLGEAFAGVYYHGTEQLARDRAGMLAAYQKAVEIGDAKTAAAAKERITQYR